MFPKLDELDKKLLNLEQKLSDPALIANQREYKKVAQEHAKVTKLAALCSKNEKVIEELAESKAGLSDSERFNELIDITYEYTMLNYPEFATFLGDPRGLVRNSRIRIDAR